MARHENLLFLAPTNLLREQGMAVFPPTILFVEKLYFVPKGLQLGKITEDKVILK